MEFSISSNIYFMCTNCTIVRFKRFINTIYLFASAPNSFVSPQPALCRLPATLHNIISTFSRLVGTHADRASDRRGRPANGAVGGGVQDDARAGGEKRGGRYVSRQPKVGAHHRLYCTLVSNS